MGDVSGFSVLPADFDVTVALGVASDVFSSLAPIALTAAGLGIGFYLIQMLLDVLRGNR